MGEKTVVDHFYEQLLFYALGISIIGGVRWGIGKHLWVLDPPDMVKAMRVSFTSSSMNPY